MQLEGSGETPYIEAIAGGRKERRTRPAAEGHEGPMADLDDIYNQRIFELAAAIPHAAHLDHPQATARAHSKLCGSTVEVEIGMEGDRISEFGQTVKACLLGQASAAIVGREIVGTPADEFRVVAATMRRMLKEGGPRPEGRWADLGLLEPVKDYPHRHASTLLVFDAVERALDQAQGGSQHDATSGAASKAAAGA